MITKMDRRKIFAKEAKLYHTQGCSCSGCQQARVPYITRYNGFGRPIFTLKELKMAK